MGKGIEDEDENEEEERGGEGTRAGGIGFEEGGK